MKRVFRAFVLLSALALWCLLLLAAVWVIFVRGRGGPEARGLELSDVVAKRLDAAGIPGEEFLVGESELGTRSLASDLLALENRLAEIVSAHPGGRMEVLVLSGGSWKGAWGAGVLRGWRENTEEPRPARFDVVTGVSTGALLSTHAFLGAPADDDRLEQAYKTTGNDGVRDQRSTLGAILFGHSALNGLDPLRRTLRRLLPDEEIDRVGREADGRGLFVAVFNMDTGVLVIWDMVALARSRQYEKYREVLVASSAIPIAFDPVYIDDYMCFDAGVSEQVFLRQLLFPMGNQAHTRKTRSLEAPGEGSPPLQARLWVLVNSFLGVRPRIVGAQLDDILARTADVLVSSKLIGNVHQVYSVAAEFDLGFRLCFIPYSIDPQKSDTEFDPGAMAQLYEAGREWAKTHAWHEDAPQAPFVLQSE